MPAQARTVQTQMTMQLLDNIVWHSLSGPHSRYSLGTRTARRYAPGFSPILGFADQHQPDFAALAGICPAGEHLYCGGLTGAVPPGWQIEAEGMMNLMVWNGDPPVADRAPSAVRLGPNHLPQILELVARTQPGPFAERTIELGEYFGVFAGERLVAMAGERFAAGALREISGVCTHPDFQGRGLARHLIQTLVRRELSRKETPFLHVRQDNVRALRVYEQMGFRHHQERRLLVVSRK